MSKKELSFWKIITKFAQLPLILVPMVLIVAHAYFLTGDYIYPITNGILLCVTIFISYAVGSIIKFLYYKPRPEPQTYKNRFQKIDASSFPSIHTANSMILAFWGIVVVLQSTNMNSIAYMAIIFLWLLFFMAISLSRVVLNKHYPIDILAGVVFGAICISLTMVNTNLILSIMSYFLRFFM